MLPTEAPYPELSPASRLIQQALDVLAVDLNTPFDTDTAAERLRAAADRPDATEEERALAEFLHAWCLWVRPIPDHARVRAAYEQFFAAFPDSPHAVDAQFILALSNANDPADPDYARAATWYEAVYADDPSGSLRALAAIALADLNYHRLNDPLGAAAWYARAYDATEATHTVDERLGFLYLQGKMLEETGAAEEAVRVYRRVLEEGEGGAGTWTDRVLDRLDALGAPPEKSYFTGLDTTPIPMTDHRFEPAAPTEISVSFWILEKPGMRRGIEEAVARYEERTPGVKVRLVDLPYTGYHDWLQSQMLGREIPDIVMIDNGSAIRYGAYQGKLVDMTPYFERPNPYTGVRWSDMYYPQFILNARDPVYRRNWIVSWASENTAYFYNKDAFRRAGIVQRGADGRPILGDDGRELVAEPRTWAELVDAFEKLREIGVYGEVSEFHPDAAPIIWQLPYYRKQLYDDLIPRYDAYTPDDYPDPFEIAEAVVRGRLDLSSPELAAPWRMIYDKSEFMAPGMTSMDIQQAFEVFAAGRCASIFWVSTDMASFEEMCDFDLGVFPFPLLVDSPFYDGEYSEEFSLSAFECSIPRNTEARGNLDAAVDFLHYFTSPEAQEILSRESVCMSPIRGVPTPEKLEPFLTRMNQRGTHLITFDPFTIGIAKEPYWADARDKLWNEAMRLLGSVPNYEHYHKLTGGSEQDYRVWRDDQFAAFTGGLQTYFEFAYDRVIREYPADLKRELKRTNTHWIGTFRDLHCPPAANPDLDAAEASRQLAAHWRSIADNWGLITRCEEMIDPELRAARYAEAPMSYRQQKRIGLVLRIALTLLALVVLLALLWAGALGRLMRDASYLTVLLPTLILLGVFSYTPAVSAIYHAFFLWNGSDISEFIGLENFREMLTDGVLHQSVQVMLVFLVVNILKFIPTVLIAVVLFHVASMRLQYVFRVIFVLPMAIPGMVGLLVWKYFYRMDGGVLNSLLLNLGLIRAPVNWLGTEETVVPALLFLGFPWISTIGVLILLAGLQSIDRSVFEAAYVDGCGVWRRLWEIELPLVMGQVKLNIVLITIGTIQDFGLPLILTRGGPNNASMLPGLWMYLNAFSYGKMGYAAALGVAMFLVILCMTYLNMRFIAADRTE